MLIKIEKANAGFTLVELMVVIVVIAVMISIAVPAMIAWRPNYQLQRAARDVYSNFQLVKMEAIRTNQNSKITFNPAINTYQFTISGTSRTVSLVDYGPDIQFGAFPGAAQPAFHVGLGFPGTGISFQAPSNETSFNNRGLLISRGCVYLRNNKGKSIVVTLVTSAGTVGMRKNDISQPAAWY